MTVRTPRLSLPSLIAACAVALLLAGCALAPSGPVTIERGHADAMARMVSEYRRAQGLGPVRVDASLMAAAEQQARTVASRDRLDHGNFAGRIHRNGIDAARAWENLAAGDPTPAASLATWKGSRAHHASLVQPAATRIGFVRATAPESRHRWFDVLVLASD